MNGMKFRVWLDKTKAMIYPESTGTPLVLIQEGFVRRFDYNIKTNEYDLLSLGEPYTIFFSTLYRDRNGKLIYEGDIVKDVIDEDYYLIQFGLIDGFYGVRLPKFDKVQGIHYLAQRVIVAGNIKENYKEFTSLSKPEVEQ